MRLRERIAWTLLAIVSIVGLVTQYGAIAGSPRLSTAYACGYVGGYFHAIDKAVPEKVAPLCAEAQKAAITAGFHVGPEQGL